MTEKAEHQDKRITTIQKLLAKAERAGTEEEGAAFFAKAEELMTKWAIDDAMLRSINKLEQDKLETRNYGWTSSYWNADAVLMSQIAMAHGVKMLTAKWAKYVVLIGFASDIDDVLTLFTSLIVQSVRFAQQGFKEQYPNGTAAWMTAMDKHVWRRSFREGFAYRVGERLREIKAKATTESRATHGSGMDLVLVSKKEQVDKYYAEIPKGKGRSTNQRTDHTGRAAGRAAGDKANLGGRAVGNRKAIR